ncbi:hypothetical protein Tco_0409028 [Tanacetum coccineum]
MTMICPNVQTNAQGVETLSPYTCQQEYHKSHVRVTDRQKNDRQGSDRQGGGGNYRNNKTTTTPVTINKKSRCWNLDQRNMRYCQSHHLPTRVPSIQRLPPRGIPTLFATHVDLDTQESVVVLLYLLHMWPGWSSSAGRKKNTGAKSTGHAGQRSPKRNGPDCFSEFHTYSEELPGITSYSRAEFNIELISRLSQSPKLLIAWHPIELKELKDQLQEF